MLHEPPPCAAKVPTSLASTQTDPGRMYLTGRGVPHDFVVSTRWFQDAAIQSNAKAAVRLEQQYWNGDGKTRDRSVQPRFGMLPLCFGSPDCLPCPSNYYYSSRLDRSRRPLRSYRPLRAVRWGAAAIQTDPNPAERAPANQMISETTAIAANSNAELAAMLRSNEPPSKCHRACTTGFLKAQNSLGHNIPLDLV